MSKWLYLWDTGRNAKMSIRYLVDFSADRLGMAQIDQVGRRGIDFIFTLDQAIELRNWLNEIIALTEGEGKA